MTESRPLTDAQQAMIIDSMNSPGHGLWNVQLMFTIRDTLDLPRLELAWQHLLDRHTGLRSWATLKGTPTQYVPEHVAFSWQVLDWTAKPDELIQGSVETLRRELLRSDPAFDTAPVQNVTLVTCREDLHHCIWVGHHAFVDGRSMFNVARELAALYRGETLEPAPPFADYLAWRDSNVVPGNYWSELLDGFEKPTGLGWEDHGRDAGDLGSIELRLSREDTAALDDLCETLSVTRNTVLQAAWGVLLSRYDGSDDVVFGSIRACRKGTVENADRVIGQFVNAVPVRLRLSPDCPVRDVIAEVRRQNLEVRAVEHASPVAMRASAALPVGARLFESVVVFEGLSIPDALSLDQATGPWEVLDRGRNGYAVTVFGYGGPEMLLRLEWHTAWLTEPVAQRVLTNLAQTMRSMADDPDAAVTRLDVLTAAESHRLLVDWQGPDVAYPEAETLPGLIAEQAVRTPDAVAVEFRGEQQTYRRLMQRADEIASALRARGVVRGDRVGVHLDRCLEMPAVLVGILRTGAAYVPMATDDPGERIRFLIQDTGARAVITSRALAEEVGVVPSLALFLDEIGPAEPDPPLPDVTWEDHAYVIFTSGSTGQPKGVINAHRGVINRLRWAQDTYGLTADDRVLQKTPYTFDVSVWEFFWPLMTGARIIMAEPDGHKDMRYLAETIEQAGVTVVHFVPSVLREFLSDVDDSCCASLRQVICSGESVSVDVQNDFLARMEAKLDNLYGPTEAAVDVSFWPCQREAGQSIVPMGWPVANTQLRVLGPHMELTPIGMTGELYIGGVQVAVGYENRPALTAERFLPDPFQQENRLYKTGDLVRHREDGALEFLGRRDHQVKVRGFRIELGEIESALRGHPAIQDAVVIARGGSGESTRLIAFVIHEGDDIPMGTELRQYLRRWLPGHMVPGLFMEVPYFPRLNSGKIDRKALARLGEQHVTPTRTTGEPLTDMEQRLVAIWNKLLPAEVAGVEDNFFELGGDSLLAMRAVLAVEDTVGHRIDPRLMFFKNLRQIALVVEEQVSPRA